MQKSQTVCVTLVVMVLTATCLNYYGVIRYSLLPSFESPSGDFNEYESSTENKAGFVSSTSSFNRVNKPADKVNNSQTDSVEFLYSSDGVYKAAKQIHNSAYNMTKQSGACKKEVPQVIVLGVGKCGTREITDFISMHPHIVIKTKPYEANYFFRAQSDPNYTFYRRQMPCRYSDQLTLVKNPFYLGKPGISNKIHKFNSTLKMIVLVRDPVDRLLSSVSFRFNRKKKLKLFKGNSTAYFYSEVFNNATGEINEESKYVVYSRYADGYREYMKLFAKDQILVIDSIKFKNEPQSTLEKVETFLGLNNFIRKEYFVYNKDKRFYCIRTHREGTGNMTATCYGKEKGRTTIELKVPDRELGVLRKYFQPYNEEFFKLLGRRMDWKEQTKV